jgi:hypothetical protein
MYFPDFFFYEASTCNDEMPCTPYGIVMAQVYKEISALNTHLDQTVGSNIFQQDIGQWQNLQRRSAMRAQEQSSLNDTMASLPPRGEAAPCKTVPTGSLSACGPKI